jgi:acetylornithine deacetylase
VDEESGGNGTLACILRGYKADGCIFTEPNGFGLKNHEKNTMYIAVGNRGAQTYKITVEGEEGATEYKHELVNPIQKAMEVFQATECYSIMRESSAKHPMYDPFYTTKVPHAITIINGGEFHGTVSSKCHMEGTLECLPNEDIKEVREGFKAYLDEWSSKDPWLKDHPIKIF